MAAVRPKLTCWSLKLFVLLLLRLRQVDFELLLDGRLLLGTGGEIVLGY